MSVRKDIEQEYETLCKKLGDLTVKKQSAEKQIEELQSQMRAIIAISPKLIKADEVRTHERSKGADSARDTGSNTN